MPPKVVLDANVLYSARVRDLCMELAVAGLIVPVWTERIETEWTSALLRPRPELAEHLKRTVAAMRDVLPEACISVDPAHEPSLTLPDPSDLHVVAAAIAGGAAAIVTNNTADFPVDVLEPLNLEVVTVNAFLLRVATEDEEGFLAAVATVRARLQAPHVSTDDYVAGLRRAGCPALADWLGKRTQQF